MLGFEFLLYFTLTIIPIINAQNECSTEEGKVFSARTNMCEDSISDDCLTNESYDSTTNECVQSYDWGEIRRDANLNIRYVFLGGNDNGMIDITTSSNVSYSEATNLTQCNNGRFEAPDFAAK